MLCQTTHIKKISKKKKKKKFGTMRTLHTLTIDWKPFRAEQIKCKCKKNNQIVWREKKKEVALMFYIVEQKKKHFESIGKSMFEWETSNSSYMAKWTR